MLSRPGRPTGGVAVCVRAVFFFGGGGFGFLGFGFLEFGFLGLGGFIWVYGWENVFGWVWVLGFLDTQDSILQRESIGQQLFVSSFWPIFDHGRSKGDHLLFLAPMGN